MKRKTMIPVLAALLLLGAAISLAQGGFDLSWRTVDGGGGTSSGGSYTLSGTVGQPEVGAGSGGSYVLSGGFWGGGGVVGGEHKIYLPLAMRQ